VTSPDLVESVGRPHWPVGGVSRRALARPGPAWIAIGSLALIAGLGFLLPLITGYPVDGFVALPYESPSTAHPFGTDSYGRDVMVRTFAASHVDYLVAIVSVGFSAFVGTAVGVLCTASRSRAVEWSVMRLTDAVISFPFIILVLALVVVFGDTLAVPGLADGLPALLLAICVTGWAYYARLARAETLSLRERDFIVAARSMGFSHARIVLRHLFPTVLMTALAYAVGDAIVTVSLTASLSFLGAGVQPPTPEWGQMMYEGRDALQSAWWITAFPALLLAISGLLLAVIADGAIKRLRGRT
jgi:peptide/nickel transport system permease protein